MILDRIVRGVEQRATLREPPDWMWDAFGGTPSYSGKSVTTTGALALVPVFSAVRIQATTTGVLPVNVYRGQGRDAVLATDSLQWRLYHEGPNSEHTADRWFELVEAHITMWGNHYSEKVKGGGVVGELWPLDPSKVHVERDKQGRKVFKIDGYDGKTFTADDILHIPGFGYDGLTGLSAIAQARQAFGTLAAREEYEARFYSNNASAGYWLRHPGNISQPAAERLKADVDAKHRGTGNAWRPGLLEEGIEIQEMGMPLKDQQFVEMNQFSATQVAVMIDVPPSWIGGATGDSLEYKTVEGQALNFVKFRKAPRLRRIERTIRHDRDLFPDRDLSLKFNVEGLLRGDTVARSAFYQALYNVGAISSEEIRDEEDMGPRIADDHYQETPAGTAPNPGGEQ